MPVKEVLTMRGTVQLVRMKKGAEHVSKQFSTSTVGQKQAKNWIESKMRQGYSLW